MSLPQTERRLHPFVVLVIVPLFAFFNAGIPVNDDAIASLFTSVPLGIVAGLFLGKQIGIFGAAWLAVRIGVGELPRGVNWPLVYGAAVLAGVGFTMSLFIASLAFSDMALVASSKLAILVGSLLYVVFGVCIMLGSTELNVRKRTKPQAFRLRGRP